MTNRRPRSTSNERRSSLSVTPPLWGESESSSLIRVFQASVRRLCRASGLAGPAIAFAMSAPASGQEPPTIDLDLPPCLLVEENGAVRARVENEVAGVQVRLFFRRMHEEVEDFYWVRMEPRSDGYWAMLPKPADEEPRSVPDWEAPRWAGWWREKELQDDRDPDDDLDQEVIRERAQIGRQVTRQWMAAISDAELGAFLGALEYEPVEIFAAVIDRSGQRMAVSAMSVIEVEDNCPTNLTPQEAGLGENLAVGETAAWQQGEEAFHWLCDGIVSRIDIQGIWRGDSICRACVVAWWKGPFAPVIRAAKGLGKAMGLGKRDDEPKRKWEDFPDFPWPPPRASDLIVLSSDLPQALPTPGAGHVSFL